MMHLLLYSQDLLLLRWALTAITQLPASPALAQASSHISLYHLSLKMPPMTLAPAKSWPAKPGVAHATAHPHVVSEPQQQHPASTRVLCQTQGRKSTHWLLNLGNHWTQSRWLGCRSFVKLCKKILIRSIGVLEIFSSHSFPRCE